MAINNDDILRRARKNGAGAVSGASSPRVDNDDILSRARIGDVRKNEPSFNMDYVRELMLHQAGTKKGTGSSREYLDYLSNNRDELREYLGAGSYDLAFQRLQKEVAAQRKSERGVYADAPYKGISPQIAVDIGLLRAGAAAPNARIAPTYEAGGDYIRNLQRRAALVGEQAQLDNSGAANMDELNYYERRSKEIDLALSMLDRDLNAQGRAQKADYTEQNVMANADFKDKAKQGAGMSKDATAQWRLVNTPQSMRDETLRQASMLGERQALRTAAGQEAYDHMTSEERDVFNYLYAAQGSDAANAYLEDLQSSLSTRRAQAEVKESQKLAKEQPLGANLMSVLGTLDGGLAYGEAALGRALGQEIDTTDPLYDIARMRSTVREATGENIKEAVGDNFLGDAAAFSYQTGMSMADSLMAAGLSALTFGGAGAAMLAGSAANDTMMQAKERGASDDQALALGGLAGVAEALFEKVSIENFLKEAAPGARGAWVLNAMRQMGIETSEESATEVANIITEALVMGDQSQYAGMSAGEIAGQVALAGLGGAISGGAMGGIASSIGAAQNFRQDIATGKEVFKAGAQRSVVQNALDSQNKTAVLLANQLQDGTAKMNNRNVGKLYNLVEQEDPLRVAAMEVAAQQEQQAPAAQMPAQTAQETAQEAAVETEEDYPLPKTNAPAVAQTRTDAAVNARTSENVQVVGIDSVDDGTVFVKDADGDIVRRVDVQFADQQTAALYDAASEFDTATAQRFVAGYDGGDVQQYIQSFTSVYKDGQAGVPYETTLKQRISAQNLTENQRIDAYAGGVASNKPTINAAKLKPGLTRSYTKASLSREATAALKKHRRQIEAIDVMAKKYGRKVVLVSSLEGMTIGGETIDSAVNGAYDSSTDTIYIAADAQDGAFAYVAMHEMVHSIRKDSAENYNRLRDTVFEALEASGEDIDALTKYQMDKFHYDEDTAIEEVIANTAPTVLMDEQFVKNLYNNDRTLFDKIRDFFNELKQVFAELTQSASWAQDAALNEESVRKIADVFDEVARGDLSQEGVVTNQNGDAVAYSDGNGGLRFSEKTYREGGRDTLVNYLDTQVQSGEMSRVDADDIVSHTDQVYETMQKVGKGFSHYSNWADAEVVLDDNGDPVFSVVKANGDYAMNLDFSLVCKKRRTLDAVFNEMIARGIIDNFDLAQTEIVQINDIIREHGFETACALCFVDAKRFRQAKVADDFVKMYNSAVKSMAGDKLIDSFNFGGDNTVRRTNHGIDKLPDDQLDFTGIDRTLAGGKKGTVAYKIAEHLKNTPADRKLVARGDFMSSRGFDAIKKKNPTVLKLYNSKKGSGGPKAAFGDVQYLSDIIRDGKFKPEAAYAVGGVRVQSFSDYVPRLVFDYVQMIGDLAAKQLPAHSYTKEELFVKQFGLTGMKINMSLIPAVVDGAPAGLDANGNYVWAKESFDYDTAVEIQNDPAYGRNCGTICVGVSDEHIRKLMADPNIRMVIPYHKSGLNPLVAQMNKIGKFGDYTNPQNTRYANGKKLSAADHAKEINFNERLHELGADGDPRAVVEEYVRWCEKNNYLPKFDKFAYVRENGKPVVGADGRKAIDPNYYKLIEDFTVYDGDGRYVPQGAVRAIYPNEGAAFGSMTDLIKRGLEEDQSLEDMRTENVGDIVDEISQTLKPKKGLKLSVRDQFATDYDQWANNGRDDNAIIEVGTTPDVLQELGARKKKTVMQGSSINHAMKGHPEMTDALMKQVPDALENPVIVLKSRIAPNTKYPGDRPQTVVVYGDLVDSNGNPILMAVNMKFSTPGRPTEVEDVQLIKNAYAKDRGITGQIENSDILYVSEDKKRTNQWLVDRRLQLPLISAHYGSIGSITETDTDVKIEGAAYSDWINGAVKTSRKDTAQRIYDTRTAERIAEGRKQAAAQQKADARMEAQQERSDARIAALEARIRELEQQVKDERAAGQINAAVERKAGRQALQEADLAANNEVRRVRAEERRKADERVDAQNQRMQDVKERTEERKYRERIIADIKTISGWITSPTDKRYVPEGLQLELGRFVSAINIGFKEGSKADARWAWRMDRMLHAVQEAQKGSSDLDLSESTVELIEDFTEEIKSKGIDSVRDMSVEQLETLSDILGSLKKEVINANKAFIAGRLQERSLFGEDTIMRAEKAEKEPKNGIRKATLGNPLVVNNLKPPVFFRMMGGRLRALGQDMLDAERDYAMGMKDAKKFLAAVKGQYDTKNWLNSKKENVKTFKLASGEEITLSRNQAMTIHALDMREKLDTDTNHLRGGGITFLKDAYGKEVKDDKAHILTSEDIERIRGWLTPAQKAFAQRLVAYMSNDLSAMGNRTSLRLLGRRLFKGENYIPFNVDRNSVQHETGKADQQAQPQSARIKNKGMTKSTLRNASTPVYVDDLTSVFATHVKEMCTYAAFAIPQDNILRVMNYKSADGHTNVHAAMNYAYGKQVYNYLDRLMADMGGKRHTEEIDREANKLISKFKAGSVLGSLSVAVQQPSAMARAYTILKVRDLRFARVKRDGLKLVNQSFEEAMEYSGTAVIKDMGGFDISSRSGVEDWLLDNAPEGVRGWSDKVSSWLPEHLDKWTFGGLWEACKAETLRNNKELERGSEAHLQETAKRFDEVIRLTQVYDSTLSRSEYMRSKSAFAQMATAFMGEPTTDMNLVFDSMYHAKDKQMEGRVRVRKAAAGLVATTVVNAALSSLVYALRDDDEDETYFEKYKEALMNALVGEKVSQLPDGLGAVVGFVASSDFSPIGKIPIVADVASIVSGYDVTRADMSAIGSLVSAVKNLYSDKRTPYAKVRDVVGALSTFTGIPVKNLWRDAEAILRTFGAPIPSTTNATASAKGSFEAAYEALADGDKKGYDKYIAKAEKLVRIAVEKKIEEGTEYLDVETEVQNRILRGLRDALKEDDRVKQLADYRVNNWNYEAYMALYNELLEEGFPAESVDGAVSSVVSKLEETDVVDSKPYNPQQWTKDDLQRAFEEAMVTGDATGIEEIVEAMKSYDGTYWQMIPQEAEQLVKSAAKKAFQAVSNDPNDKQAVEMLELVGYDQESAQGWENDAVRDDLYSYMDNNDWRSMNSEIQILKKNGVSADSIKSGITNHAKTLLKKAKEAGDTEAFNQIVSALTKISVYDAKGKQYYTRERILGWKLD